MAQPASVAVTSPDAEHRRLAEDAARLYDWRLWGPYVSERQWGTVREDYSPHGEAWEYLSHEDARARTYRWGEDGIAGISDIDQRLCLALALWNGRDPYLKERMFGLTGNQGCHGEDVKEIYWYLDAVPSHAYLRMLYKYPQTEFPYAGLLAESQRRGRKERDFTLLDLGVFDENRYFDVFVEYAKADVADVLMRITVHNRGPDEAVLHVLPHLWFTNDWSWRAGVPRPMLRGRNATTVAANHPEAGAYTLSCEDRPVWLFTENESNPRVFGVTPAPAGYFKDAFHEAVVRGRAEAVNPLHTGTKTAAWFHKTLAPGASWTLRLRLTRGTDAEAAPFTGFDSIMAEREAEADLFYQHLQHNMPNEDARLVQRQALAGMIWSKQYFNLDVYRWLRGDPAQPPPPPERRRGRNSDWRHLAAADIFSMPDKWEYPWFAAWDTAFHCLPFAMIDPAFAKDQLLLLTSENYMHPNGQIPAYEWAFGDVNPPVHGWAAWRVFQIERRVTGGRGDLVFLERIFHKLILNFSWWVNRKDAQGRNVFQGGFLGLDNIGVFNRSEALPTGGYLDQTDGTAWMAMYALNLMRIAIELAQHNNAFEDIATKFFEHFLYIARALTDIGEQDVGLWNEQDEFFYDVLNLPDGRMHQLRLRTIVGLIPMFAVETIEPASLKRLPNFSKRLEVFLTRRVDLAALVSRWDEPGLGERRLLSLLRGHRLKRLLARALDASEFLSDHGVRSLSAAHGRTPYVFEEGGRRFSVSYEPGEGETAAFGGNSNWRGPVWMPINYLIVESLEKFHHYYGDDFKVECPTGSGHFLTLLEIAQELSRRLTRLFLKGEDGHRPIFAGDERFRSDPHFKDMLWFHEYFHGDTGRGLGAAHQTGWTGLVAQLLRP
jgi:hypothetical protein